MSKNQNNIPIIIGVIAILLSLYNTYQINNVMTSQSEQVAVLTEEISKLQSSLNTGFEDIKESLGSHSSQIENLEMNISDLSDGLGLLGERIIDNVGDIHDLNSSIDELNNELVNTSVSIDNNLNNLNSSIHEFRGEYGNYTGQTPNNLYQKVRSSVVLVNAVSKSGSGFMWYNRSYILTNWHVVNESTSVYIQFYDNTWVEATIVDKDPFSDVALLRIPDAPEGVEPLELVNSSTIIIGQQVVAIGNPFGISGSLSYGVISQVNTKITLPPLAVSVFQIDLDIAPGSSGGPLLTLDGKVVGITNAGTTYGINYAIPSNMVRRVAESYITKGEYHHAFIGFSGFILTPGAIEYYNVYNLESNQTGIIITSILDDSPADKAGLLVAVDTFKNSEYALLAKDIIVAVDDISILTWSDLSSYFEEHVIPGQVVTLQIWRSGEIIEVEITTEARDIYL